MITIGKITDRIGFNGQDFIYLGNRSGSNNTELDSDNKEYFFFDENNVTRATNTYEQQVNPENCISNVENSKIIFTLDKVDSKKIKLTDSFINNTRFYYCVEDNSKFMCLRCVESCTTCVNCQQNCYNCVDCTDCQKCVGCQKCTACQKCARTCYSCDSCTSYGCSSCYESCTSCDSCTSCFSGVSPSGHCGYCYQCQHCADHCLRCAECQNCASCQNGN